MKEMPPELLSAISSAGEAVLGIGVLAGVGAWGGMWLDDRLHTTPWLAICLALTGMGLGLTRMVMKALQADKAASTGTPPPPLPPNDDWKKED